jgi:hypothetical protein
VTEPMTVQARAYMTGESPWRMSDRFHPAALPLADRHYNRQKIGSPQFVPPGRCLVLQTADRSALWVTSWPYAQFVRHAWPGAWVNSLFRNEGNHLSSDLKGLCPGCGRPMWTGEQARGETGLLRFTRRHKPANHDKAHIAGQPSPVHPDGKPPLTAR